MTTTSCDLAQRLADAIVERAALRAEVERLREQNKALDTERTGAWLRLTQVTRDLSQRLADAIVERADLRAENATLRLRARLKAVEGYCPRCHERMYP